MKKMYYGELHNISGDKIREYRLKHRYSQAQLAIMMQTQGISIEQDAISRIERGQRIVTDYELQALGKVLRVSVTDLLSGEK